MKDETTPAQPEVTETKPAVAAVPPRYLVDSYLEWVRAEGPPVYEDFGVDLLTAETGRWPRLGDNCDGAFIDLKGRGDNMTVFLLGLPPAEIGAAKAYL